MKYCSVFLMMSFCFLMACKSNKAETVKESVGIQKSLDGKVLVTLLEGKKTEVLEADFEKYSLKHKSIASRSQNQHLFTFDKEAISTSDLIKKLNKNKIVYLAEPLAQSAGKAIQLQSGQKKKTVVK